MGGWGGEVDSASIPGRNRAKRKTSKDFGPVSMESGAVDQARSDKQPVSDIPRLQRRGIALLNKVRCLRFSVLK